MAHIQNALQNALQAIDTHAELLTEIGLNISEARSLAELQADPEFACWIFAIEDVPVEKYLGPVEKINIPVPRLFLARFDGYAEAHRIAARLIRWRSIVRSNTVAWPGEIDITSETLHVDFVLRS